MAAHRTEAKLRVDGLAVSSGDGATRIELPHAELAELSGHAGRLEYRATGLTFDQLHGRFGPLYWSAEAATAGGVTLRDPDGRFTLTCGAIELPRGIAMSRAAGGGIELVAATATLSDVRLHLPDLAALRRAPSEAAPPPAPPPPTEPRPLRQERLRFLDAVKGAIGFRLKIVLDLPVLGKRTLDQPVRVDIVDGAFDYRALDDGLTWLEGAFLDLGVSDGRFKVGWSVPMFSSKEIISWALAPDAQALAVFNRIPLRVLADVRVGGRTEPRAEAPKAESKSRLKSLTIPDIDVGLSMVAPRSVEVGGGTILFGGEGAPGLLDLKVAGALVHPPAPGAIKGRIGALDLTVKDVRAGGVAITADRLHLEAIDQVELQFDGFKPTALTVELRSVTATNLALIIG